MLYPLDISREEALRLILSSTPSLETITLGLEETLGYASGQDVRATQDLPPFDRSAMDGYAVRSRDTTHAKSDRPARLQVVGEVDPSTAKLVPVQGAQTTRIMTGGPMPPGTDAVIKEEDTLYQKDVIEVLSPVLPFQYVRRKGNNLSRGTLILERGGPVTPGILNIMANLQMTEVSVFKKTRVSVISIGNELAELHEKTTNPRVVASNIYMLSAMIRQHGGRLRYKNICSDDEEAIKREIEEGLKGDMLITTGGSSNAHSDLTRTLLADMGIDFKFVGVSMRPGKGTSFGLCDGKPVFCLPGTPSAVYVVFHTLVLPALLKQMGFKVCTVSSVEAVLEEGIKKKPGTEHVVQGVVRRDREKYRVRPLVGPDMEIFSAMGQANSLIFVTPHHSSPGAGETISVQPVNPSDWFLSPASEEHSADKTSQPHSGPPVVSIVGKSDAGKTTLLEKLVRELKARGYRVGTIKHDVHGFDIDHEGKDSWRHKQAGAATVVISSPQKVAMVKDVETEETPDRLAEKYFADVDIVLTEGYKREDKPKIEIFRSQVHDVPLCMEDRHLVALVSDTRFKLEVPQFALEEIKGLADFVEETFLLPSNQPLRRHPLR